MPNDTNPGIEYVLICRPVGTIAWLAPTDGSDQPFSYATPGGADLAVKMFNGRDLRTRDGTPLEFARREVRS